MTPCLIGDVLAPLYALLATDARPLTIAFFYCTRVKNTWFHFSLLLTRVLGTQFTLSLLSVFFFFQLPSVSQKRLNLLYFIVKTILYGIWVFCIRATCQNGKEDHRVIIKFISSDISMRVRLDQFRLTESLVFAFFLCLRESGRISLNLQLCSIYLSLFTLSVREMRYL